MLLLFIALSLSVQISDDTGYAVVLPGEIDDTLKQFDEYDSSPCTRNIQKGIFYFSNFKHRDNRDFVLICNEDGDDKITPDEMLEKTLGYVRECLKYEPPNIALRAVKHVDMYCRLAVFLNAIGAEDTSSEEKKEQWDEWWPTKLHPEEEAASEEVLDEMLQ
jgi:hypothetical protein